MARREECPPCDTGTPAWMVTYGDMVTLLLCLFVLIYATGKVPPTEVRLILSAFANSLGFFEGGQTLSKGRMEEMGMNLESLPSQTAGHSLSQAKKQARSIFKPEIKTKKVRITEDERGLVISLVSADYFQPGSALLTPAIEEVLKKTAGLMRGLDRFTRIEGHAAAGEDEILVGERRTERGERNYLNSWDLSAARAVNTATFLHNYGVPPDLLSSAGYGSYRPLAAEAEPGTPEAAAFNRRIDIVILPFKPPRRGAGESGYGLPGTRIPGSESLIPDR